MADLVNRKIVINRTSGPGHARPGRAGNRSGHVRYAAKAEAIAEHQQLRDKPLPAAS
jgi:hypothetical protein